MKQIAINSPAEIKQIRISCQLAAECLSEIGKLIRPGISTQDLDDFAKNYIMERGAYPSPLHYHGFPRSICTSVNSVICHGIPNKKTILKDGDIINVDVTTFLPKKNGMHGDTNATFYVGQPSKEAIHLVETTRECINLAIEQVKEGARLGDVGAAIQNHAQKNKCSVVKVFVGHGVGKRFHMPPQVNHFGTRGAGLKLMAGMVFTIEPMINLGSEEAKILDDGWTAVTIDGKLSAQFEHTVLVTKTGNEILTIRKEPLANSENMWKKEEISEN